jgi:hypothetical protein
MTRDIAHYVPVFEIGYLIGSSSIIQRRGIVDTPTVSGVPRTRRPTGAKRTRRSLLDDHGVRRRTATRVARNQHIPLQDAYWLSNYEQKEVPTLAQAPHSLRGMANPTTAHRDLTQTHTDLASTVPDAGRLGRV